MTSHKHRVGGEGDASALSALLLEVETLASDVILRGADGMTAAGAVGAATMAALEGRRAAVLLAADQLFDALF